MRRVPGRAAVLLLVGLTACARQPVATAPDALARAERSGLVESVAATAAGPVRLRARGVDGATRVHVYIEGDGHAWRTRTQPSRDPTPRRPVALELALADPSAAVVYLGRPCQYATAAELERCDAAFWTSRRYSALVVEAYAALLDALAAQSPRARFGLVGFSGGAAIAALLAARRDDIDWLVTVAGNLDTEAWAAHHAVAALDGSLNPAAGAHGLRDLAQVHLFGADDRVVPRATAERFIARAGATDAVREIEDFDHGCCWAGAWPQVACAAPALAGSALCAR